MRVAEKIVREGKFWLSSNTKDRISGKLIISDGGEIRLEMTDVFGKGSDDKFESIFDEVNAVDISRILGVTEKGPVTLDGCFYLSTRVSTSGINTSHIHVSKAMLGVSYEKNEIATFNTFMFSVEGLEEWLSINTIKIEIELDYNNYPSNVLIKHSMPEDISFSSIDDIDIQLVFGVSLPRLSFSDYVKIKHLAHIKLVSEKEKPLSDFIAIATKLNSFLCFAIDKTVSIKDVVATSNSVLFGSRKKPKSVEIFYKSSIFSPKKLEINANDMLFLFPSIKNNSSEIIKNWLEMYKATTPAVNSYLHKINTYVHMDDKFLALVQWLEVYHQKIYKEVCRRKPYKRKGPSLNERLCDLLNSFKNFYSNNSKIDKIAQDIAGIRNYLIHRDNEFKDKAQDAKTLYFLSMIMESIFQLHLLKKIGFTDKDIEQIAQANTELKWKLDMNNAT